MKNIFLIALFLASSNLFSQNNKLYSIPQYRTVLEEGYLYGTITNSKSSSIWSGDTLLNGKMFTKVYHDNLLATSFVREDSIVDSLYFVNELGTEFKAPIIRNLAIGDTVRIYQWHYRLFLGWQTDPYTDPSIPITEEIVSQIDQVMINGRLRNKYYFSTLNYIEGVGISSHWSLGGLAHIQCFFEKNNLGIDNYDGNPAEEACSSIKIKDLYNVGSKDVFFKSLLFYPNPTSGILKFNFYETTQIEIYSVSGENMGNYNLLGNGTLDLSHLKKGVYFLSDKHSLKSQKLMIK